MPQILTLFFNFFFFFLSTNYILDSAGGGGGQARHGSEVKFERSDMGKTSWPWGQFVCVPGKCIIPASCQPFSLKEQAASECK